MKKIEAIHDLLRNSELTKKIDVYFATRSEGDSFDPLTGNYEYDINNLNPITIRAIVTQVSPTQLVYKQYGLSEQGAVEILTEGKYKDLFEQANKIVIDDIEYEVFKKATGGRSVITERANSIIRVVLTRK